MTPAPSDKSKLEFDEDAARAASYKFEETIETDEVYLDNLSFIWGARWQFNQLAPEIERLRKENEKLKSYAEAIQKE